MNKYFHTVAMIENEKEGDMKRWRVGQERREIFKNFKLIYDPDETWGYSTHLSRRDIHDLICNNYIMPGCKFVDINNGQIFEIKYKKKGHLNGLILAPVDMDDRH